jgi:hypothetical protein
MLSYNSQIISKKSFLKTDLNNKYFDFSYENRTIKLLLNNELNFNEEEEGEMNLQYKNCIVNKNYKYGIKIFLIKINKLKDDMIIGMVNKEEFLKNESTDFSNIKESTSFGYFSNGKIKILNKRNIKIK